LGVKEDKSRRSTNEQESEGEEEEENMADLELGPEEESKEADQHFLDTMKERLAALKDKPLPQRDTPLPNEHLPLPERDTPLPRRDTPLPETPPQSEGMLTRARKRSGGGKMAHVPNMRAARQQWRLPRLPPPLEPSIVRRQQPQVEREEEEDEAEGLKDEEEGMRCRGQVRT
jgi:hypothetical protein